MSSACTALGILLAASAARAEEGTNVGLQSAAFDNPATNDGQAPVAQRYGDPRYGRNRRQPDAREGLLISFGLGGGSLWVSNQGDQRIGAFDLDFRLGYGFSDRYQLFMDAAMEAGTHPNGADLASWTFTVRGQTVLAGDRAGNGLNLNFGVGVGGITYNSGYINETSSSTGLALAGGLSYDARVSPWFAISPEFFYTWHAIPNGPGYAQDVSSMYGLRLNFLWYLH